MAKTIQEWLGNSQDANAIALAIEPLYAFEQCFEMVDMIDHQDADILARRSLSHPFTVETSRQMLFDLIREVWDAGYSHGYYDGRTEAGENMLGEDG